MVYHLLQIELGLYQAVQHLKTEDNLLVPRLNRLLALEKETHEGFVCLMNATSEAWTLFCPFRNNTADSLIICLMETAVVFICRNKECAII